MRANGLRVEPGHTETELTNENPGALAGATGAKDDMTGVLICPKDSTAFPILQLHWGMVA